MNRQHLLSRLATDHAVVYSNGAWPSWDRRTAAFAQSPLLGRFDRCDGVTVDHELACWCEYRDFHISMNWRSALRAFDGANGCHKTEVH